MNFRQIFGNGQDFPGGKSNSLFLLFIEQPAQGAQPSNAPMEETALKCPYCGNQCPDEALYCDVCKQPLPTGEGASPSEGHKKEKTKRTPLQRALIVLCWVICFAAVGIGVYKLVFWIDSYKITRLYTRGAYAPTRNEVRMSDGRLAHALIFYGEDGDLIYLPELDKSLSICGGVARLEIADADWFGEDVSEYDYADISFTPVLIQQNGRETQLPLVEYTIEVPQSPLEIISPATNDVSVVTSSYPLQIQVVPGSSLFVNGEDLTDRVDRSGAFSGNVSVRPIGDNTYTVIVRTPRHKETRYDVTIYRQKFDIEIELDSEVSTQCSENTMPIKGRCEPGAAITVDTPYLEESLQLDVTTGEFSFIAEFEHLGDNVVRFRATMDGRQDAVISFTVNYKPTLAQYSANAWKMDYEQLRKYFENWIERVFLCKGTIVDVFTEEGVEYMVMDVGTSGDQQLVILENYTGISPSIGPRYAAYADVTGRHFYQSNYYPMLAARYMDLDDK